MREEGGKAGDCMNKFSKLQFNRKGAAAAVAVEGFSLSLSYAHALSIQTLKHTQLHTLSYLSHPRRGYEGGPAGEHV